MEKYELNIIQLYPDLLNLYGDKGNIASLKNRLLWRSIGVNIEYITSEEQEIDFEKTDLIFLGGGGDIEQEEVLKKLLKDKDHFANYIEKGKCFLALCGGFSMLLKTLILKDKKIQGLGILDLEEDFAPYKKRMSGNIILKSSIIEDNIVGFENHTGTVVNDKYTPFGIVISGAGSDVLNKTEGIVYKNLIASYLHGPLLPKNPKLCDYILLNALKNKYSDINSLTDLDDSLENSANKYIASNYSSK